VVVLYLVAGLGGSTLLFVFGPFSGAGFGGSAAVLGLLAANSIFKYKSREDVRADIGLFVLLILYSVLVGFQSFGWLMLIGGIVVGALVGLVLAYAPRQNRTTVQVVGLLGVVLLCLGGVIARLLLI
jgi:membrane associated rhomboid family serine protease